MSDNIFFQVEMVDTALELLLENLRHLLEPKSSLIVEVIYQVQSLYNNLCLFKEFFKDSRKRSSKNEVLKVVTRRIRDVVYQAEDIVDMLVSEAAVQKSRGVIGKVLKRLDYSGKKRSLKSINEKLKNIYEDTNKFGFDDVLDQGEKESFKLTKERELFMFGENYLVGFEDEAEKLIRLLTGGSDELEVVSIVGMPGLGKTTLAKLIYNHPHIKNEFYYRAWVCVSPEYSRKQVFLGILSHSANPSDEMYENMTDEKIAKELGAFLEKGKYLIVMDDVWTEEALNDLKIVFPKNKMRSRILLTSRINKVANQEETHYLRFLNSDESWTLLQRKAFDTEECPRELLRLGRRIADECHGLPLALVTIGGILREKDTKSYQWEKVLESVNAYIAMDQEKKHMDNIIALSFNHMPYHLKACLLYFGVFPEEFFVPAWKLICLWIAEGFIQEKEKEGKSLEDIAENYLGDLIDRNLVMVGERGLNGKVKTCFIHSMVYAFCKNQAEREDFFQEIKPFDQVSYSSSKSALEIYRRICIHSGISNYISSKPHGPNVRSFLCFSEEIILQAEHISSIPKAFKLLRVLDARPISFTRFPTDLAQLVHLRYLVLAGNFRILPAAISSLWNMQTFIVVTSSKTLEIKGDIWKMIQLRHLKTNASTSLPGSLAKPKNKDDSLINANLRTVSTISPESCKEDVFARAPYLNKLGIRGRLAQLLGTKDASSLFDSLGKLDYLETLKLLNNVFPLPPSEGKLTGLPQSYKFPPNLKKLTLAETLLDWVHMSTLGLLPKLEILKLKDDAFKGDIWKTEDGGFCTLEVLHIGKTDLVHWVASAHHFPRLERLYLKRCSNLQAIPLGLADVPSLQIIDLYCTTKSAAASARKLLLHKQQMQEADQQTTQGSGFKVSIYPPDQEDQ